MERIKELLSATQEGHRVILGCTGSVASIRVPQIARTLQKKGITVLIVPTEQSLHFLLNAETDSSVTQIVTKEENLDFNCDSNQNITCSCEKTINFRQLKCKWCKVVEKFPDLNFVSDAMEWDAWQGRGDPVLHIELRKWADLMVIAPLSANSLAKLASGLCDNLLTCIVRAWDMEKTLLFCPAMNTKMYEHPLTAKHIAALKEFGYKEVASISKTLMCGDTGQGAMASVDTIVEKVLLEMSSAKGR